MRGVVRKQRVQRIDADDACPFGRPQIDKRREIGEVADAPVAAGAQRIELRGGAPDAAGVREAGGA